LCPNSRSIIMLRTKKNKYKRFKMGNIFMLGAKAVVTTKSYLVKICYNGVDYCWSLGEWDRNFWMWKKNLTWMWGTIARYMVIALIYDSHARINVSKLLFASLFIVVTITHAYELFLMICNWYDTHNLRVLLYMCMYEHRHRWKVYD